MIISINITHNGGERTAAFLIAHISFLNGCEDDCEIVYVVEYINVPLYQHRRGT